MPTITLDKSYVLKLLGKKYSDSVLADRIAMLGTDLERIDNKEIIVEIFPNRPDMLSEEGFARALSSFLGIKKGLREYKIKKTQLRLEIEGSVKNVRPFIKCAIVKNVKLDDAAIRSLMQLQEKLHQTHGRKRKKVAIGVHDFSKIRFPLTYKAVKPDSYAFVPIGDKRKLSLEQILKKTPKGQQFAFILEDKEEYPIIVDANDEVISFPPIINSEMTQVTEKTSDIFVDVTGTDELAVMQALNIIVTSLAERNGKIYSLKIGGELSPKLKHSSMKIDIRYVNKLLHLNLKEKDLKNLLSKMGLGYNAKRVLIPPYRVDILHPIDIVEDIAIAYGYENFEPVIPKISTIGEEDQREIFFRRLAEILIGFGFLEISTCHLTNYSDVKTKMNADIQYLELSNSVSSEFYILRPWLLPSLIKTLSENKTREYPHMIFEIGTVFLPSPETETRVLEKKNLALAIASRHANFTRIKQVLDALMNALGIKYSVEEMEHPSFIPGRVANIVVDAQSIGFMGELSPAILNNWQLETPVCCLEIDIEKIYECVYKALRKEQ